MKKMMKLKLVLVGLAVCLLLFPAHGLAAAKYVMKVAHNLPADPNIGMSQAGCLAFKDYIEKATAGQVEVKIFPAGQMGDQRVMFESTQMGTLEMSVVGDAPIINWFRPFGVIGLPYAFKDSQTAWKVLDGKFGKELSDGLVKETGVRILGYGENGFRHLTNSKRNVKVPDDVKGLKIRVQENQAHIKMIAAMGGIPTPMAFGEVYTSLQQGVLDGQENPINVILIAKLYEIQKYLTLDGHVWSAAMLLINDKYYNSLPEDIRKAVDEASVKYNEACREVTTRLVKEGLDIVKEKGMQVTSPTAAELDKFRQVAQKPVAEYLTEQGIGEWVKRLQQAAVDAEK